VSSNIARRCAPLRLFAPGARRALRMLAPDGAAAPERMLAPDGAPAPEREGSVGRVWKEKIFFSQKEMIQSVWELSRERRAEVTFDGTPLSDLVCWPSVAVRLPYETAGRATAAGTSATRLKASAAGRSPIP